jgi:hypothetical protein
MVLRQMEPTPVLGPPVRWDGRPSDDRRSQRRARQQIRILGAGGTVLIDAGRLLIDEATGEILQSSGPKHFDDYFIDGDVAALRALCDAVG